MKAFLKIALALVFSSLFFSCASSRFDSHFSPVYVTNTSKFAILSPNVSSEKIDTLQHMKAKFGEKEMEAEVYVISNTEQISMTILSEFGSTVANLFYDGVTLDLDSAIFPKSLKAEYLVADLQFCLYNPEILKSELSKIGVDFEISAESDESGKATEKRILSKKGKLISKITKKYTRTAVSSPATSEAEGTAEKSLSSIEYENTLRGYGYTLTTIE